MDRFGKQLIINPFLTTDWFMERQYNNEDFEKQLRDNANQYRMYPSEKVWKGIHSALHTRRRWYGVTAAIMFLITSSIVSIIIYNGNSAKNGSNEQIVTPDNNQLASVEKQTRPKFTPAINTQKPKAAKKKNVEELIFENQAFISPYANEEETNPTIDQTSNETAGEEVIILIPVSVIEEPINNESIPADPNLTKFSSEIQTEKSDDILTSREKTITDQDRLDAETENKIKEVISALASQNIPFTKANKQSKVTAQVYFTPTVSYRSLSENKRVLNSNGVYVPLIDLNNVVKHKPAMGVEFGIEGRYHVSDKMSIKAGFQFNINRYDIRAYTHTTEIATVALNSGSGFDSLATTTNYRNFGGGSGPNSNWLENFYFQAGVPIGIELILTDNKNIQWGVSGTLQPTYVIGDRAYVISSDYKNYARFPDLMRRWNISTGIGTFVSYSTGKIKWQVGPHVRYQHLSSFVSALTVKEKLFAIGLKVGATLNKNK
jgi:hypothetical protein